jgi:hypothetical protein
VLRAAAYHLCGELAPRAGWRAALVPTVSQEIEVRDGDAWEHDALGFDAAS